MQSVTRHLLAIVADAQFLDVISINVWNIVISLLNLLILFLIVKHFLFRPVKQLLDRRQAALDRRYAAAAEAPRIANENRDVWEQKMETAVAEADARVASMIEAAQCRAEHIMNEADERANGIIRSAEAEAEAERARMEEIMKREIVEIGATVAEKMLKRELNENDHRTLIDDFIESVGEHHETDR